MQSPMFDPAGAGQQLGDPRRLILDWQRPMYDLACRMLGNEADAADATQEIFLTVLRQLPRYDRRRPFRPWLYRLATNVIRNGIRNSRLRRERETQAAMNAQHRSEGDPLERLELERLVHGQVAKLPEALRSLILLHYYHGLTQEEAAQALSIPRTTARSRIQKALETLRRGLAASGSLAVAVDVESLMKTSAPIPVPPQVTASLMAIAADAGATAAVTTGITVGGILMTKQVIAGAVLVGLVCLAAGYLAGRTTLRADGEPARRLAGPKSRGSRRSTRGPWSA
jgi:RNA polymerase sigma factor (sigma-70 family)